MWHKICLIADTNLKYKNMRRLNELAIMAVILLSVSLFSSCDLYTYSTVGVQTHYENPQWAPSYYAGIRYYYLPDIEAYYDLSAREFVYLSNGQWYYSASCPSNYAGFDLNDCFTVALDVNIYQPWMHHQYYVSHYPRYYYRDYYDHSNIPYVRGFNENSRRAVYWSENERNRARSWDGEGLKTNRQFKYSRDDRQQQNSWNSNTYNRSSINGDRLNQQQGNSRNDNVITTHSSSNDDRRDRSQNNINPTRSADNNNTIRRQTSNTEVNKATQRTNYYGRSIGQPVKVERQMRQQSRSTSNSNQNSKRIETRTEKNDQERK